jgi:hypothetical protein
VSALARLIAARLRAAGLEDDPALEYIQEWNNAQRVAAELDPRRAGHRGHWRPADHKRGRP